MAYISNADLIARVGAAAAMQLADDNGDGTADAAVLDEVRLGAEGEVNSYLGRRYAVPVDVTSRPELADMLATVTLDIAELRLRGRRPPAPEDAVRQAGSAREWLARIADGVLVLPSVTEVGANAALGLSGAAVGESRRLSHAELADY